MKIAGWLWAMATAVVTTAPASAHQSVYYGLTVLDPVTKTRKPDSYIIVDGNKIVAIGRGKPPESIPAARRRLA